MNSDFAPIKPCGDKILLLITKTVMAGSSAELRLVLRLTQSKEHTFIWVFPESFKLLALAEFLS